MDGYNACLFAYGQTGTGKTHTVLGNTYPSEKRGLLPRILEGLFEELAGRKEASEAKDSSVQISYLEIFNEQIHDLLVPPPKSGVPREALQVRYHPILGVMINDLTQSSCSTIEEAMELVDFGTRMRSIAATSMNSRSSRAHTVFTFKFEQTSRDGETQMAQIQLVDLAGREQEKSSSDNKDRLRERQFINTSLFHLSTCILNLSRGSKAREVCAFRNSRLTLLLANSLSGNSRTGMIAAVSPASSDLDETISTLRFADHVKKIRTSANCNKVNKASVVKQLQEEIAKLRAQMDLNVRTGDGEKVSQLEAICAHFKEALEQEKSRSQALAAERAECLKEMGLSVGAESVSIVVGADRDGGVPYLVNLSDDPYLQGCLMYFLKGPEDVTIGSADSNKVRMSGLGIKAQHCIIRNEGNRRLFLHPLTDGAENEKERPRVFLNGRRVTDPVEMHHQDRIILGHSCAFRVAVPLTASELKAQKEGGSSGPEGGTDDQAEVEFDQALAEIEDASTQSFGNLGKYVEDLEHSVGREVARAFVCELRRAVPLVDEANQITREMAQDFVFALQVLTDLCSSKTTAPEMVVAVTGTAGSRELKFVWTLEKFTDRLQSMRDLYEEIGDGSNIRVLQRKLEEEPYNNPWREIGDGEVRMMIDGLNAGGKIDPIIFVSQSSSRSVHPKAGRVHSLEAKSDELLARSQFLLEEGTAVLQRVPVLRPRSPTIDSCFDCNGEGESGLEQLELEVAEGMKKLSQWYNIGRRASISNTSSHLAALRERALTEGSCSVSSSRPAAKASVSFNTNGGGRHAVLRNSSGSVAGDSSCLGSEAQGSWGSWHPEYDDGEADGSNEDIDPFEEDYDELEDEDGGLESPSSPSRGPKRQDASGRRSPSGSLRGATRSPISSGRKVALDKAGVAAQLTAAWQNGPGGASGGSCGSGASDISHLAELTAELRKENFRLQKTVEDYCLKEQAEYLSKVEMAEPTSSRSCPSSFPLSEPPQHLQQQHPQQQQQQPQQQQPPQPLPPQLLRVRPPLQTLQPQLQPMLQPHMPPRMQQHLQPRIQPQLQAHIQVPMWPQPPTHIQHQQFQQTQQIQQPVQNQQLQEQLLQITEQQAQLLEQQQKQEQHSQELLAHERKMQEWAEQLARKEQTLSEMQKVSMQLMTLTKGDVG
ncbi:unnamed protein product [Polarella glacialis]|uniref:Kinesin motor domain-containing protein n=1 Tax=Polarella glacialis TaxID=89957 RepID=A0A813J198_POLGL|nr:unnamed protein product [Polarella glacialis]